LIQAEKAMEQQRQKPEAEMEERRVANELLQQKQAADIE